MSRIKWYTALVFAFVVVLAFLLYLLPSHAQHVDPSLVGFTQEELDWLARAVVGEMSVMGEHKWEAGTWVVHVALNRQENKWFPSNLITGIKQGFNGAMVWRNETPPAWAYSVVYAALYERRNGFDPTAGSLFLFGGQDIVDCMDFSKRRGMLKRNGWVFSVHLFTTWPYSEGCWYE